MSDRASILRGAGRLHVLVAARRHGLRAALGLALASGSLAACASNGQRAGGYAQSPLALQRVVLYQNGVGYFERSGSIDGRTLRLRVRKDQVNDLLKSLVVVDRKGRVLGVSLPLDPQSWHRAALAALTPGHGKLAEVLDSLRGTTIRVDTKKRRVEGRIVMVERMQPLHGAPQPGLPFVPRADEPAEPFEDHKLTVLDGDTLHVVRLSEVDSLALVDGDIAMQLDRHLDASAGEGMFQQVELEVRLENDSAHDLALSYVAQAPQWKPSYRLVLQDPQPGKAGQALLQAWAVVDNTSGETWQDVELSLTSGAPLAFRYDLHTPREVERPDLSYSAVHKQAQVALGERTMGQDEGAQAMPPSAPSAAPAPAMPEDYDVAMADEESAAEESKSMPSRVRRGSAKGATGGAGAVAAPQAPALSFEAMQKSTAAQARASQVAGLTRFDLPARVTLPDGSSTMVALINQPVPGEQVFMYRPGGSGQGYELNPYRVVRFQNDTAFVLEPGPISIYSGGSFVGEGLAEAVGSHQRAVIPFAVEPSINVRMDVEYSGQKTERVRLLRGVLEVESFNRVKTTWTVQGEGLEAQRVLIRHPRQGGSYELVERPKDTEDLPDAYFVPVVLEKGKRDSTLVLTEQTPTRRSLSVWDGEAIELLEIMLSAQDISPDERKKLEPIVAARRELGRIQAELQSLEQQREQLDQRATEARASLKSIEKDKRATELRKRLQVRLEEVQREADGIGRRIVELQSKQLEVRIGLEDLIEKS